MKTKEEYQMKYDLHKRDYENTLEMWERQEKSMKFFVYSIPIFFISLAILLKIYGVYLK